MNLFRDIRHSVRRLLAAPGFTLATIVVLALGIGANSALFTTLDHTVLRPLPYPNPDRLVALWEDYSALGRSPKNRVSPATFLDWQKQAKTFEAMGAYGTRDKDLAEGGPPEEVLGLGVSPSVLPALGVQPYLGRTIAAEEDTPGVNVVVLSYRLWQGRFGGNRNIIGSSILMSGEKYTVVGVMPRGFQFPNQRSEFWIPLGLTPQLLSRRNSHFLYVVGRLKPGLSVAQAQKELDAIAADLAREYPSTNKQIGITTIPLHDEFLGDRGRTLAILLCAAASVLLIACANVANLLLARSAARQQEIAVRTALGASSGTVLRQILTENLLLSFSGGVCSLLIAKWMMSGLSSMIPPNLIGLVDLSLDWRALAFASAISAASGFLFGIAPAVRLSKGNVSDFLKGSGRGSIGPSGGRLRDALVVAEIGIALVLVISATLLIETLGRLRSVDTGFNPERILTATLNVPFPKYQDTGRRQGFYNQILDNVKSIPGVKSVGLTSDLPFTSRGNTMALSIEGRQFPSNLQMEALFRLVSAGYLETIGARLVEGRLLRSSDQMDAEPVVVVNETLARQYWPNESAIGRRIDTGTGDGSPKWMTIVGVVHDVRERGLDLTNKDAVYVPFTQTTISFFLPSEIAVRTSREPLSLAKELQQAVWSIDAEQPLVGIGTMDSIVDGELAGRTQVLTLLGAFAGLALLLASFGTYSVLSYVVSLRSPEIGLRMAVGANRWDIAKSMLAYSASLATAGVTFGLAGAVAATRLLSSLLYGISAADPTTFVGVSMGLFLVALLASCGPLLRATRIDPMTAIRQ